MSYDVYLEATAGTETTFEVYEANHTSNTAVMWREAGCDLAEFDGKSAADLRDSLNLAIADIEARPDHYAQWNPPNRWGSVATTLDFLSGLRDACEAYPLAIVRVSR